MGFQTDSINLYFHWETSSHSWFGRGSSIAVFLIEREQGNDLSSVSSCLVTTDGSVDLYFPLGEYRHYFNSLLGHLHTRVAIYINNQVWQHLPRLSHSVIKWPYVPGNRRTNGVVIRVCYLSTRHPHHP